MIGRDVQSSGCIATGIQSTPFEPTIREQRRIVRPTLGEAAARLLGERCARVTAASDASAVQTNWSLVEAVNQDFAKGCVLVLDFCWEEREIQFWAVGARVSHLADVVLRSALSA
jgi:hypothetical protein